MSSKTVRWLYCKKGGVLLNLRLIFKTIRVLFSYYLLNTVLGRDRIYFMAFVAEVLRYLYNSTSKSPFYRIDTFLSTWRKSAPQIASIYNAIMRFIIGIVMLFKMATQSCVSYGEMQLKKIILKRVWAWAPLSQLEQGNNYIPRSCKFWKVVTSCEKLHFNWSFSKILQFLSIYCIEFSDEICFL